MFVGNRKQYVIPMLDCVRERICVSVCASERKRKKGREFEREKENACIWVRETCGKISYLRACVSGKAVERLCVMWVNACV